MDVSQNGKNVFVVNDNEIKSAITGRVVKHIVYNDNGAIITDASTGREEFFIPEIKQSGSSADTSDATAVASDVSAGVTFYGADGKRTGTMPDVTASESGNIVTIPAGRIRTEQKVIVGTAKGAQTYTPRTSDQTIAAGAYLTGKQTIKGDANLTAANIRTGVSIFNVEGTFTADADATASDIASGKTAYVKGEKVTGTATGSSVTKLYVSSKSKTDGRLYPIDVTSGWCSSIVQKPERRGTYTYYIVVDGKLYYYSSADGRETYNRTRAVSDETGWLMFSDGMGVKGGELYTVTETTYTPEIKILTNTPKNVVQIGRTMIGRHILSIRMGIAVWSVPLME